MDKILLSFVIPCYRSEKTIKKVIDEILDIVSEDGRFEYEIIAVNDCSPDGVYSVLLKLAEDNCKIKVINLVKNVGKHAAVLAGYSFISGDYVINLDDDYQSPVEEVWKLLEPVMNNECDVAMARYKEKKEAAWKVWGSNINLLISEKLLEKPKGIRFENLSVMKRFVAKKMTEYINPFPYLEGLIFRVTNKVITIPMEQRERVDNSSTGFTFRKSLSLFVNGFTGFSVKPLRVASVLGLFFALTGFVYGVYITVLKILRPEIPAGWSSLMTVELIVGGIIMTLLGIIGEYVGRIFICINHPPQYVIRNTINIERK